MGGNGRVFWGRCMHGGVWLGGLGACGRAAGRGKGVDWWLEQSLRPERMKFKFQFMADSMNKRMDE